MFARSNVAQVVLALSFISTLSVATQAEVPSLINYQGRLVDTLRTTVPDGNYSVTFRIHDDSIAGNILWEEGRLVSVIDGLFSILLGSIVPVDKSIFDSPNRWFGYQIGLTPEMLPRTLLVSVPYSFSSAMSDSAVVAQTSLDKTIDAAELTTGMLDTSRFSAFSDLENEQRIGNQTGQLAIGDHIHPGGVSAGVAFSHSDTTSLLVNGISFNNAISVTLNAPADGFAKLQLSCYTKYPFRIGIGTTATNDDLSHIISDKGFSFTPVSWNQIFPVVAGSNIFYVNLKSIGNAQLTATLFNVNLSAIYIENNYGN